MRIESKVKHVCICLSAGYPVRMVR